MKHVEELSLRGERILVTGVSRSMGIGPAIVRRLSEAGASVVAHGYGAYDQAQSYRDADSSYPHLLVQQLQREGLDVKLLPPGDLSLPGTGEKTVEAAAELAGAPLTGLVLNHAYSTWKPLGEWTQEDITLHLQTNVTAAMMMIQKFEAMLADNAPGCITLFTSGQTGPMIKEIAYAVSKDAIVCLCRQTASALAGRIRVNCINPGPTDTGYLEGEAYDEVARLFPDGRWGMPEDAARLVHFLHSPMACWITGQVITSDGGFSLRG